MGIISHFSAPLSLCCASVNDALQFFKEAGRPVRLAKTDIRGASSYAFTLRIFIYWGKYMKNKWNYLRG